MAEKASLGEVRVEAETDGRRGLQYGEPQNVSAITDYRGKETAEVGDAGLTVHLSLLSLSRLSTSLARCLARSSRRRSSSSLHCFSLASPPSSALPGLVRPSNDRAAGERSVVDLLGVAPPGVAPPLTDASIADLLRLVDPPPPAPAATPSLPLSAKLLFAFLAILCANSSLLSASRTRKGPTLMSSPEVRSVTGVASIVPQVMSSCRAWAGREEDECEGRASTKEKPETRGVCEAGGAGSAVECQGSQLKVARSERAHERDSQGVPAIAAPIRLLLGLALMSLLASLAPLLLPRSSSAILVA